MKHTLSLTLDTLLDKKNGLRTPSVGFRVPLFSMNTQVQLYSIGFRSTHILMETQMEMYSVGFRLPLFLLKNTNETVCNRFQVGILAGGKHTDAVGFKSPSLLIRNQRKHTHTRTVGVADPQPARHSSAFWSNDNNKIYV